MPLAQLNANHALQPSPPPNLHLRQVTKKRAEDAPRDSFTLQAEAFAMLAAMGLVANFDGGHWLRKGLGDRCMRQPLATPFCAACQPTSACCWDCRPSLAHTPSDLLTLALAPLSVARCHVPHRTAFTATRRPGQHGARAAQAREPCSSS
jgi:hypothetical protein